MASPESSITPSPVAPAAPAAPAAPGDGQTGQASSASGSPASPTNPQGGNQTVDPYRPPGSQTPGQQTVNTHWIEVELKDQNGRPVSGEPCVIVFSDNVQWSGTLDQHGFVRVEGVAPGTAKVNFPNRDRSLWRKV
jgi:hypothetical protein